MKQGSKVILPNGERGEILRLIDDDQQAIVLTHAGRKVGCHLIRLSPDVPKRVYETSRVG